MGYIGVITHLLTIDPNFQRNIQVVPVVDMEAISKKLEHAGIDRDVRQHP